MGGTRGLARPHGDGPGPEVVEWRSHLPATLAGGTTPGGATTLVAALVGIATPVGVGSQMRGHKDSGWRAGRSLDCWRVGASPPRSPDRWEEHCRGSGAERVPQSSW
jgi:hypothetical protein